MHDYDSGLDPASFTVTADFASTDGCRNVADERWKPPCRSEAVRNAVRAGDVQAACVRTPA